jgi:lipoyl synthase
MIRELIQQPLHELQTEAFRIRTLHFGDQLTFAVPGMVSYQTADLPSHREHFAAVSVTGTRCDLKCDHCQGKLLESMIPAETPEAFLATVERLQSQGGLGLLLSGGANRNGEVPLEQFISAIRVVKDKDPCFKIIVHTGLIQRRLARDLKEAGVDQILIDVIGDEETIRQVYHLDRRVEDYEETLAMLREVGHRLAPHIIIGHHFGEIRGEWRALEMVTRIGVDTLVLVVIKPLALSRKRWFRIPTPEEVARISSVARILNPSTPVRAGCIRPAHPWKARMEKGFIDSGVNTIAYPLQGTIEYAQERGLQTRFVEMCCSLL